MSDSRLWNEIGKIYQKMGSRVDAIAAYSNAIELDPDSGWPYCNLGHAYFLAGEFGNALFLFRKSIQLMDTPENQAFVWNKIGDTYRALKDIDNAIRAYKKADNLDMGPSHSEQGENKQTSSLSREMNKTEKVVPESNNCRSSTSVLAMNSEPLGGGQTIEKVNQSVDNGNGYQEDNQQTQRREETFPFSTNHRMAQRHEFPESPQGNQTKIASLPAKVVQPVSHLEDNSPLIPDSKKMTRSNPQTELTQSKVEQNLDSEKSSTQVEIGTEKVKDQVKIDPNIENLEEVLAKVNIYENITRVNPTSDRAWDTLGKLYKSLGRYKDAINAYQKAIELTPDKEVYHYYLGLLYAVEQRHDDAVRAFLFVLHKNPDYVLAHSALAGIYHRMGLETKANHHIAIALPKMNNESAYNRACFYAICGDTELALEFLRLALENKDTTIEWMKSDPDLDPIRNDQRFQELIFSRSHTQPENPNENYFSSEMKGNHNRLLPILNNSLAR
jgi:tetratricopeptide (TPR) repeat protein